MPEIVSKYWPAWLARMAQKSTKPITTIFDAIVTVGLSPFNIPDVALIGIPHSAFVLALFFVALLLIFERE
ncbi:hypothetical protein VDIAB_110321 [Vibrio diabolicus]|nr:hypothetical protein VDIAB_110321 [Vibrio diabolicus]